MKSVFHLLRPIGRGVLVACQHLVCTIKQIASTAIALCSRTAHQISCFARRIFVISGAVRPASALSLSLMNLKPYFDG